MIARSDSLDPDDDSLAINDEKSTSIFGLIWSPVKGLSICPNVTKTTMWDDWDRDVNSADTEDSVSDLALNFQFKF